MGVKKIFLINSRRVEKSYWQSPILSAESLRGRLILGLEQARDTVLPEVLLRPLFKPFVEDELPGVVSGTLPLRAHPAAAASCPRGAGRPVTLAVGPEGGFIPYEIENSSPAGFSPSASGNASCMWNRRYPPCFPVFSEKPPIISLFPPEDE